MAEFTEVLNDAHVKMIGKQPIFFLSTAAADGRINLSPKGLDCFRVLGPRQVGPAASFNPHRSLRMTAHRVSRADERRTR